MYVGSIAPIVNDKDDQAIGPNHAQSQHQYQHSLNRLRDANVHDEIVAGVTRMRAARVLHSRRHEQ